MCIIYNTISLVYIYIYIYLSNFIIYFYGPWPTALLFYKLPTGSQFTACLRWLDESHPTGTIFGWWDRMVDGFVKYSLVFLMNMIPMGHIRKSRYSRFRGRLVFCYENVKYDQSFLKLYCQIVVHGWPGSGATKQGTGKSVAGREGGAFEPSRCFEAHVMWDKDIGRHQVIKHFKVKLFLCVSLRS